MTTELRQINFEPIEVCAAIRDYHRRRSEALPAGDIVKVTFGNPPDVTATLDIKNGSSDAITSVTLNTEALAAALILFCINQKIPLPAKAQKKLQLAGGGIGLLIRKQGRGRPTVV